MTDHALQEITVPLCESFAAIGIDISETDLLKFEAALFQRGLNVAQSSLRSAAERVCWFDWSDNDPDAVHAIDRLRLALDDTG